MGSTCPHPRKQSAQRWAAQEATHLAAIHVHRCRPGPTHGRHKTVASSNLLNQRRKKNGTLVDCQVLSGKVSKNKKKNITHRSYLRLVEVDPGCVARG